MSAQVLVVLPGAISAADRNRLRRAGVVCVEARPDDVKLISFEAGELAGSDILLAAIRAIDGDKYGDARKTLVTHIRKFLEEQTKGENDHAHVSD